MALYNLIGCRDCSAVNRKLCVNIFCVNFSSYKNFFVKVLIEMNVNISNGLQFCDVYRSVNYIGLLANFKVSVILRWHTLKSLRFLDGLL